jgi:hypothetical protein
MEVGARELTGVSFPTLCIFQKDEWIRVEEVELIGEIRAIGTLVLKKAEVLSKGDNP